MLTGVPGRRLPRDISRLQPAFDQLQLPWLCPSIYGSSSGGSGNRASRSSSRPRVQRRSTATNTPRRPLAPARAHTSPSARIQAVQRQQHQQHQQQRKNYANAATHNDFHHGVASDDFYVPIVSEPLFVDQSWARMAPDLPPLDPTNPLIVTENYMQEGDRRRARTGGIVGMDVTELRDAQATLEACLAVGYYPRAAHTLRYLNRSYRPDMPEIIAMNNFYLGHLLGVYVNTADPEVLQAASKWYYVDMVKKAMQPDASTYALMVQVVMRDPDRNRAGRSVRRFLGAAYDDGVLDAVKDDLYNAITAAELDQLTDLAPAVFENEPELADEMAQRDAVEIAASVNQDVKSVARAFENVLPSVRPVELKGRGLDSLLESLSLLQNSAAKAGSEALASEIDAAQRQLQMEEDTKASALKRWEADREETEKLGMAHPGIQKQGIQALLGQWQSRLAPALREAISKDETEIKPHAESRTQSLNHFAFLRLVNPERAAIISLCTVLDMAATCRAERNAIVGVVTGIGKAIETEAYEAWAKSKQQNRFTKAASRRSAAARAQWTRQRLPNINPGEMPPPAWSKAVQTRVGITMLELMLKVAKMPAEKGAAPNSAEAVERPAMVQEIEFRRGRRRGIITLDAQLQKILSSTPAVHVITKFLPMVVQPKPWSGFKEGAYLGGGVPIVRLPNSLFQNQEYIRTAVDNGDMKKVLQSLDSLGKVPWRVNREVLDVMLKVWNTGDEFLKIPPIEPDIEVPEPLPEGATLRERIEHKARVRDSVDQLAGLHSERCFQNFQIETARSFVDEVFYLPHNLDFRGRAYPIPPYLNQMGADNARGLLLFANGKELGARGLQWLKVHLANLYGFDKASLSEREEFTDKHLEDALDSANNPLDGRGWWKEAEDAWQCLSTCMELRNALRLPDPTKYVSHLPVHQDGTCNGLQHYAALGGDVIGAQQVNLEPGDRPSDIYTAVANHVKASVAADAAEGVEMADALKDKIVRKVVKQTVMTNVYGVTWAGARAQIQKQLVELYPDSVGSRDAPRHQYSSYLASKTFAALGHIFNGAIEIQKWLGKCADGICTSVTPDQINAVKRLFPRALTDESSWDQMLADNVDFDAALEKLQFRSTLVWTTPLRMPVVQPYRKDKIKRISSTFQDVSINNSTGADEVHKRKQLQAFPPNYIHSLDATHMQLSALRCEEAGLDFAAVHDSFWTHAADIDKMNVLLRDAFVQMHAEDVIGRLAAEFRARYKGHMQLARVPTSSPLGKRIMKHRRQNRVKGGDGARRIRELAAESQRLQLLASEDPEQRQQGEAMITPGRLFAEATEDDFIPAKRPAEAIGAEPAEDADSAFAESHLEGSEEELVVEEEAENEEVENEVIGGEEATGAPEEVLATGEQGEGQLKPGYDEPYVPFKPAQRRIKKQVTQTATTWVWKSLEFPEVPKRGSWDVTRLKESKYFFS